jgi:predicted CoA-substrate-specific enzyme activase
MESGVPESPLADLSGSEVYLGIDVGSISTNVVALDAGTGKLVAKSYLMTAGRPLEAVKTGLARVSKRLPGRVSVAGAGATGSGRYMVGDFVGADVVQNEITAQARAAVEIDPAVDTIFEIGGQDSKYISLRDGRVVDFEMNKVCAAGTGSFLEEQAERLGLDIRDFGDTALESPAPAQLGERCTVFMESDVVSHQASGTETGDIVGGLCYSIVRNYLHRVVGERRIGERIFFQGGTAYNRGVVAAFNSVLGERGSVAVPPHHDVTGAIGAALLAREHMAGREATTGFRGFGLAGEEYTQSSFVCHGCSNSCEIHRVELEDGRTLFYGGRCERYERDSGRHPKGRNHFSERLRLLGLERGGDAGPGGEGRPTVGLPRALWFWERYPFFGEFFEELGMRPVVSAPSNARIVHRGVENVAAETCFPVKIAHGHVLDLLDRGVDYLFLPSLQRAGERRGFSENYSCPFVQGSPYVLDAGLGLSERGDAGLLTPVIDFSARGGWRRTLIDMAARLGFSASAARRACDAAGRAQRDFDLSLRRAGRRALSEIGDDEVALVVVARPYNSADTTVSIDIPEKLSRLGATVIPMDFLDLPLDRAAEVHGNMYWHYGQRILAAALAVREDPRLNAVYLTNFGCGPDSFIQHVFDEVMGEKPYLALEIDEHAADAGIITRCEAFLDSLRGRRSAGTSTYRGSMNTVERPLRDRTLWIPLMSDATRMAAAAVRSRGVDARAIPPTCRETVTAGREATTGKECYPSIITTGNMLRILKREGPRRTAFFMGTASGPCRFGQYCGFQRLLLRRKGLGEVPVLTSNSSGSYGGVPGLSGPRFQLDLLRGIAAADVLHRALLRVRPYEGEPGAADEAYGRALAALISALEGRGGLREILFEAASGLSALAGAGRRPLVYVFGEIYVRNDPYANGYTVDHIERLGGEVLPTPLVEWFEYVSHSHVRRSLGRGRLLSALRGKLKGLAIHHVRRRMEEPFEDLLSDRPSLRPAEILRAASPYMTENPGGEAVLCVGAPLAYLARDAIDGAVNIFPFTCLPGTIVTAISKRLRREHPGLPWLNLAFDGQEDTDNLARLEAFMHQVRSGAGAGAADREAGAHIEAEGKLTG